MEHRTTQLLGQIQHELCRASHLHGLGRLTTVFVFPVWGFPLLPCFPLLWPAKPQGEDDSNCVRAQILASSLQWHWKKIWECRCWGQTCFRASRHWMVSRLVWGLEPSISLRVRTNPKDINLSLRDLRRTLQSVHRLRPNACTPKNLCEAIPCRKFAPRTNVWNY